MYRWLEVENRILLSCSCSMAKPESVPIHCRLWERNGTFHYTFPLAAMEQNDSRSNPYPYLMWLINLQRHRKIPTQGTEGLFAVRSVNSSLTYNVLYRY